MCRVRLKGNVFTMRFGVIACCSSILFSGLLCTAPNAVAHHSLAAYDSSTVLTIKGTVTRYEWRNPHIAIRLGALESSESEAELIFEGANTGRAERLGWSAESFRSGDTVSVSYNPFLNGRPGGHLVEVTTDEGEVYSLIRFRDRRNLAPAGLDVAQ